MRIITSTQAQEIKAMMDAAGIPVHVWLPIMHLESRGNPAAHNPRGEDSRGLFQINLDTAPAWVRELNLFDPIQNVRAILTGRDWLGNPDRIKRMLGMQDPAEQAAFMWRRGIRPRWDANRDRDIRHYATAGLDDLKRLYGLTDITTRPSLPRRPPGLPLQQDQPWIPEHLEGLRERIGGIEALEEDDFRPPNIFERLDRLVKAENVGGRWEALFGEWQVPIPAADVEEVSIWWRVGILLIGIPILIIIFFVVVMDLGGKDAVKAILRPEDIVLDKIVSRETKKEE